MSSPSESLRSVSAFVSGELSASAFEQILYHTPEMELLLSVEKAPSYFHTGTTVFHYLIALDYDDLGDVLSAQGVLTDVLNKHGVAVSPSDAPRSEYNLILSAQPKWLDADAKYLSSLLASAPPSLQKKEERKAWLRQRLLELFRYVKHPPRWLQSPAWPISDSGPLVFLGQFNIDDYFHDTAAVYVFHDPATGECKSVVQVA